jgi:hypothetical protein
MSLVTKRPTSKILAASPMRLAYRLITYSVGGSMKTKRKGVKINCLTFRVLPDPVVDLWRDGILHDSAVKVWVLMQRLAYEHKGEIGFTAIWRYCGVARATLAKALKQLMEHGLIRQDGQTYTVVFDQPRGSISEPTSSISEPTSSISEPTSSISEPTSSISEPTSSISEPTSSISEPNLSSKSRGELRRHVDTIGESPETPTARCAASLGTAVPSSKGEPSADSHIHISPEDLALLAQRYGIHFQRTPSPWACVMIRNLLDGDGGEGHLAILRALAKRTNGFGGGAATAAAERNTIGGAQQ